MNAVLDGSQLCYFHFIEFINNFFIVANWTFRL